MGTKSNFICGLDIGTSQVTAAIAEEVGSRQVKLLGFGSVPSRGLRKGVVINIEATVASISEAIKVAESGAGVQVGQVYASLSGSHIQGFNSHGIVGIKGREVSQADVEGVIEAAKAVAIPLDREVIHVLPQEFIIDNQDGIHEPLGISGVRLEAKVHMVSGSVASAQNIVKCANRCGLVVRDIVVSSLASAKSNLSEEEEELGVCLLDIGAGTSDVIVFKDCAVQHTSVIPVGGSHITNDIAAGLRTPLAAAERIKCEHGAASVASLETDTTIEVPSTGGRQSRVLSQSVLSEIIEPRVRETFQLIRKNLVRAGCEEMLTSGLVLTGGSAGLAGIAQVAEEEFDLPVRIGAPTREELENQEIRSGSASTVVGLLEYAADDRLQLGNKPSSLGSAWKRVAGFLGQHF